MDQSYRKGGKEGHLVGFSAKVPPTKKKRLTSSFSVKREARETMKERRKQNERNGGVGGGGVKESLQNWEERRGFWRSIKNLPFKGHCLTLPSLAQQPKREKK